METVFLVILIITMIAALASGFPVAFALPGSAIVSICLAALFGYVFEGDVSGISLRTPQQTGTQSRAGDGRISGA